MNRINKDWHMQNKMPDKPTPEQRARWHIDHLKNCACRQPTPAIQALMEEYQK
jgi:Uri superfamily endonuclease